jgi:hypothetical protein
MLVYGRGVPIEGAEADHLLEDMWVLLKKVFICGRYMRI